ncbi:MAG: GAF domain-containing protein [Chloroflexi bacterium]|nr:GAF domain-containing protein [Chloroflexota bacterium]
MDKQSSVQPEIQLHGLAVSLEQVMDSVADELILVDDAHQVQFANATVRQRMGPDAASPLGQRCYQVLYGRDEPCSAPLWDCALRRVLESGVASVAVHRLPARDTAGGKPVYVQLSMYPLRDEGEHVVGAVCAKRDVSAERELESEIVTRHHQLRALSRISSAVSGLSDLDEILEVTLDTVLEIIHGSIGGILLLDERSQTLQYQVQRGLSARFAEEMQCKVGEGIAGRVAKTGKSILLEDISADPRTARQDLVSAEGLRAFVSVPIRARNKVVGVMNIASHVPGQFATEDTYLLDSIGYQLGTAIEQARLYERLRDATERYQRLLQHALTAQEEERKRIARELHDGTSQMLTGLSLNLQAAMDIAEMDGVQNSRMEERLKKAHFLAVQTSIEVTKLINDLRPTLLDSLGLAPAIQRYLETWLQPKGINTSLKTRGHERLPSEVEVALFRITQEAINNITKHAEAKNVNIDLQCDGEKCVLRIEDDGKGFDVQEITKVEKTGRGVGLFGMKERVTLVGGSCSVQSEPGQGTVITSEVPLTRSRFDAEDTRPSSG